MLHEQGAVTFHLLGGGNGQKSNLQKPLYITGVMRTHTHADEQVSSYLHCASPTPTSDYRGRGEGDVCDIDKMNIGSASVLSSIEHQSHNVIFRHFRQLFRKHFFQRHQSFQCSASAYKHTCTTVKLTDVLVNRLTVVGNDAQREQAVVRIYATQTQFSSDE